MRTVPNHIPHPDYAENGIAESERDAKRAGVIKQLSLEEIQGMKKACRVGVSTPSHMTCHLTRVWLQLGREVLDIAAHTAKVGVTTDEVDRVVHEVRPIGCVS